MYPTNPSTFLVRVGRVAEYSPLVSTVTAIVNTIQKIWLAVSHESRCHHSYYYTHIKEKHWIRVLTIAVPFLGNLAIFLWDLFAHKSNLKRLQLADQKEQEGVHALEQNNPLAAKELNVFALYLRMQTFGSVHSSIARSHEQIGYALERLHLMQEANDQFEMAERIRLTHLSNAQLFAVAATEKRGWHLYNQGEFNEAIDVFNSAYYIRTIRRDHLKIAHIWHAFGSCYLKLHEYNKARNCFKMSVRIASSNCHHPTFSDAGYNHTWKYFTVGGVFLHDSRSYSLDFENATLLSPFKFNQAHRLIADALLGLGLANLNLNTLATWQMRTQFEIANFIRKNSFGMGHLKYAETKHALGYAFLKTGDSNSAHSHFEPASQIRSNHLSEHHPLLEESLYGMGITLCDLGRYQDALEYLPKSDFSLHADSRWSVTEITEKKTRSEQEVKKESCVSKAQKLIPPYNPVLNEQDQLLLQSLDGIENDPDIEWLMTQLNSSNSPNTDQSLDSVL